jgi:hypothetical protein
LIFLPFFIHSSFEWQNEYVAFFSSAIFCSLSLFFFHSSSESRKQTQSPEEALTPMFLAALTPLFSWQINLRLG